MIPTEVQERYLRPRDLKENLESSWSDTQHVWLQDKERGFVLVKIIEKTEDARGYVVELPDHTRATVDADAASPCNAARFDMCEDIAEMSELNEATVLHNLRQRYDQNMIYTYSGLFLVAVNPYHHFPIYTDHIVQHYKNQRRIDRPPHIFAIADAAYRAIVQTRQNQSILITGESGAGKTENTKRVIQYLTSIAGGRTEPSSANLEQQIVAANPIMEAFGNAQTVRNNNSSRFGKFVRIEFNNAGSISGGNIEKYLLEKSRVTHRNAQERSFHIFYQFLKGAPEPLKQSLLITGGVQDYSYTRSSNCAVDGIDDRAEFSQLVEAMQVLGFTSEEQMSYFRIVAAILLLGNLTFEEDTNGQAKLANSDAAVQVCECLGVATEEFVTGLLNPAFKAGRDEIVAQSRNVEQVTFSVEALSRALYDRMFTRLVERINRTIDKSSTAKANFIGVLDIAGFEIFAKNSFEQLCINHTNEKLQQFFNHHMFVIEQEEYKRENIQWEYIDFGLDLQPTIDLIEKSNPIGVMACLDEDSVVPKATDKSFSEKLSGIWKGKSAKFESTRFGYGFIINHYAGKVEYSTDGWLVKNKDPLNENITRLLARSSNTFVHSLFADFSGSDEEIYQATKGTKRGLFRTVSQKHRESLSLLMQQLYSTQPHFIRCIIPNEDKKPRVVDAGLVLDQLRCNGVLEGIRICRLGYPNRLSFADFCRLYEILATKLLATDSKSACIELLGQLQIASDSYRIGQSKVFFRAGELGKLEEMRDRKLSTILRAFQAYYRYVLAKRHRDRKVRVQGAAQFLQRNIRLYLRLRQWSWWRLFCQIKPLLNFTRSENRIEELEGEMQRLTVERDNQIGQIRADLDKERNTLYEVETRRRDLERENQQLSLQLTEANDSKAALMERKLMQDLELVRLRERISSELEEQREKLQGRIAAQEKEQADSQKTIEEQKELIATLKGKLDEVEFERLKLEKAEAGLRQRQSETETIVEEARRSKKDLETKLRLVEDARRHLQEQLDDETADQLRRRQMESEYETQLRAAKQQHEDDLREREEEWEQARKRLQREIHQLSFDFEQEKRQSASFKDTIKRYESGTDNLATQLEAEMRNQSNWKRERERLEQRVKEVSRHHQEAIDREDALQAQMSQLYESIREFRARSSDLEEAVASSDRQRKALEVRYESLNEQHRELSVSKQTLEKNCATLDLHATDLATKLHGQEDLVAVAKEQLRTTEQILKITQVELEDERRQGERLSQEKAVLELQIKELQLKLLDSETSPNSASRTTPRRASSSYSQAIAQIEAEGSEKQQLIKECRRQERQIRELQSQLADRDRLRIGLEESLDKSELRFRKLMTSLEAVENRVNELEVLKRRFERDLAEQCDNAERLGRECERLKSRSAAPAQAEPLA